MKIWIDELRSKRRLPAELYRELLMSEDESLVAYLRDQAREVAQEHFGRAIYLRGLIEITNRCQNNCYYCGIRGGNREVERYTLSRETILDCCRAGYELGLRTFVMQGGESGETRGEWLEETVRAIRGEFPDCAITLSLGEMSREEYERLFRAGANRYLLRHESYNLEHYNKLHPAEMSHSNRLRSLDDLKEIGFQTGTGVMAGSPYQTIENLVEDILFMERFEPEMIGIGAFIPHHNTPFANEPAGSVDLTLRLISIMRLIFPTALIPSTTALATLHADGHLRGIEAGASVIMPNLSPAESRSKYLLYDNKASFGAEAAEGISLLANKLATIGYSISFDRGDHVKI